MKKLLYFLLIAVSFSLYSCKEDELTYNNGQDKGLSNEIEFLIESEDDPFTRGIHDESKIGFEVNDQIHIIAEFEFEKEEPERRYILLKYSGNGAWSVLNTNYSKQWPHNAKSGNFKAYYLPECNGALSENTMESKLLSDYNFSEVPMSAEVSNIAYGAAVRLNMKRMFSYLILTEINENIANEFWFVKYQDPTQLNNAFHIEFDEKAVDIAPIFSQIPNESYKAEENADLVYVKTSSVEYEMEDGTPAKGLGLFLQPSDYHGFSLLYPVTNDKYASYLSYNGDLSELEGAKNGLQPNRVYIFSILRSQGIVTEETPDDIWDESGPTVRVDVEQFLKAANAGSDYWEHDNTTDQDVQILESTGVGSKLLRNVDFNFEKYYIFENDLFKPVISNVFDGGYHYIHNIGSPVFYESNNQIKNLGIKNGRIEDYESNEELQVFGASHDSSYVGALVCKNNGDINNIRIVSVKMSVRIKTSKLLDTTQEAHNSSLLSGVNYGSVSDVYLSGNLFLTIDNAIGETIVPQIFSGGLSGQNLGSISAVQPLEGFDDPKIKITINCQGDLGSYFCGGFAGKNTGNLYDIYLPSIEIDASASKGVVSKLGGMVGEIANSQIAPYISDCIARGSLKAGDTDWQVNQDPISYLGGIAGSMNIVATVKDTSVSFGIDGSTNENGQVEYSQGGVFGRIEKKLGDGEGSLNKIAAFGSTLTGPGYKGNFAGLVPEGKIWDDYKDNEITVRQFLDNNIGGNK